MGGMNGAVAGGLTTDLIFLDQREHVLRPGAEQVDKMAARLLAKDIKDLIRRQPQAGIEQTGIAARPAEADVLGFEDDAGDVVTGQMKRGGAAGVAAANDGHVGGSVTVER
jgi:hypothetical protein